MPISAGCRGWRRLLMAAIMAVAAVFSSPAAGPVRAQVLERSTPTAAYYADLGLLYDGQYRDALRGFQAQSRGAIKTLQSRWIDSICYETMCGECYFQMGLFDQALPHYTAALQLYKAFPDWMAKVQFAATIRVASPAARRAVPWGASTRQAQLGSYPFSEKMLQGQIDVSDVVQQGGVVQQANLFPVTPQEIVRATALAMRRRATLLGPASKFDPLTDELIATFSRPVALPNHWSEAYANLEHGLALAAGGRDQQAQSYLEQALLAAGQFDHPLTDVALLELGRLAFKRGDYSTAAKMFDEATYAAVNSYSSSMLAIPDCGVLEEAFRYGFLVHVLTNRQGPFPPLAAAIQWTKAKNLRQLRASLLLCAAENYTLVGQPRQAAAMLDEARATDGPPRYGRRLDRRTVELPGGPSRLSAAADRPRATRPWRRPWAI